MSGVPLYGCLWRWLRAIRCWSVSRISRRSTRRFTRRAAWAHSGMVVVRVSRIKPASADSVLLMSDVNNYGDKTAAWEKLVSSTYIQRTWGDSYGYLLVATGRAEIMLDSKMAVWDCGAVSRHPRRSGRHVYRLEGQVNHLWRRVDCHQWCAVRSGHGDRQPVVSVSEGT